MCRASFRFSSNASFVNSVFLFARVSMLASMKKVMSGFGVNREKNLCLRVFFGIWPRRS